MYGQKVFFCPLFLIYPFSHSFIHSLMKIFYLWCSQPPVQMYKAVLRNENVWWREGLVRLFVFVSLVTGLVCREWRMTGGYMGHTLCCSAYRVWRQLCMCGYVCAHNVEREVWAQGLCIGKCCNLCVFLLALSVFTRRWVKLFWRFLNPFFEVVCQLKMLLDCLGH